MTDKAKPKRRADKLLPKNKKPIPMAQPEPVVGEGERLPGPELPPTGRPIPKNPENALRVMSRTILDEHELMGSVSSEVVIEHATRRTIMELIMEIDAGDLEKRRRTNKELREENEQLKAMLQNKSWGQTGASDPIGDMERVKDMLKKNPFRTPDDPTPMQSAQARLNEAREKLALHTTEPLDDAVERFARFLPPDKKAEVARLLERTRHAD